VLNLRRDVVPDTVENFRVLCNGAFGATKRYKGSAFHRVSRLRRNLIQASKFVLFFSLPFVRS